MLLGTSDINWMRANMSKDQPHDLLTRRTSQMKSDLSPQYSCHRIETNRDLTIYHGFSCFHKLSTRRCILKLINYIHNITQVCAIPNYKGRSLSA